MELIVRIVHSHSVARAKQSFPLVAAYGATRFAKGSEESGFSALLLQKVDFLDNRFWFLLKERINV